MIEGLSGWAEQIIVAVMIATLIEMLLPNGNNKKYIKAVLGIYLVFTILSPILSKITTFDFNLDDYEKYFENTDTYQAMSDSLSNQNNQSVEEIYITNLKQDMKQKLKEKGYEAEKITIKLDLEDGDNYGKVNAIYLTLNKIDEEQQEEQEEKVSNQIVINQVEIGNTTIGNTKNTVQESGTKKKGKDLTQSQKKEIKKYLSGVYEVKEKNITINEDT